MLDHLKEAGFYSSKDLLSVTKTLANMRDTLDRGRDTYSPALLKLLEGRLEGCDWSLEKLQKGLSVLAPDLVPTHETLVSVLRSTSAVNTRSKVCGGVFISARPKYRQLIICPVLGVGSQ